MPPPPAAADLVAAAAVGAAALVSLRLGRMRGAARAADAVMSVGLALTSVWGLTRGGSPVLAAGAAAGAAFAVRSAVRGLRGLALGATGAWGATAAVATAADPAGLVVALAAAAGLVWGETARADPSDRPRLATRRLMLTLVADLPLAGAAVLLASRGLDAPWAVVVEGLGPEATAGVLALGVWSSAAARAGLFPLSLWRGRTAALGRGPAAVAGPVLALPAGLALWERFGPLLAGDPASEALRTGVPAAVATTALIALAQSDRRAAANAWAAVAAGLATLWMGTLAFAWAAAAVVLAAGAALLVVGEDERPVNVLPDGAARRLGRRQFYLNDAVELATLPVRGAAQLARFADAAFVVPAVTRGPGRLLAAVDAEVSGSRWVTALVVAAAAAAAWWGAR